MTSSDLNNNMTENNEDFVLLTRNEFQKNDSNANNSQKNSTTCNQLETTNLNLEDIDMTDEEYLHISPYINKTLFEIDNSSFNQNNRDELIVSSSSDGCIDNGNRFDMHDLFSPRTLENINSIITSQEKTVQQFSNDNQLNYSISKNEQVSRQEIQRQSSMNPIATDSLDKFPKAIFKTHVDEMIIYKDAQKWHAKYIGQEYHVHDYDVVSETDDGELTLYDIRKKIFIRISPNGFLFFGHTPLSHHLFNTGEWVEFRVWKVYAKQIYYKCVLIRKNEITAEWEEYKDGNKTGVSFLFVNSKCDEIVLRSKTDSSLLKLNSKELCQKKLEETEYKHIHYGTWEFSIKGADQAKSRPVWTTPFSQLSFFKTRDNRWFEKFRNKKNPEHVYKEWLTSESNKEIVLFDIDRHFFVKLTDQGGWYGNAPNQINIAFSETSTWCSNCIWKMSDKENYFIKTDDMIWTSVVDGEPLSTEFEFVDNENDEVILKNKFDSSYVKLNSEGSFLKASTDDDFIEQAKGTWTEIQDWNGEIHSIAKVIAKTLVKMVSYSMGKINK